MGKNTENIQLVLVMCYKKQISEIPNNLKKCMKMSELHRPHGIIGNAENNHREECGTSYGHGARLKFFKDGKFILELKRTLEGEKTTWVSVHQKTYWPPKDTVSVVPSYQPEGFTLLSDDNSSLQSSQWHRDHASKQLCPRRNISSELNFFYWKPKIMRFGGRQTKKKIGKKPLTTIVQSLIDKNSQVSKINRIEIVSPRKRFLPEIEKEKIVNDDICQKRSRSKSQTMTTSSPSFSTTTISILSNGIEDKTFSTAKKSYSINSLLTEHHVHEKSLDDASSNMPQRSRRLDYSLVTDDGWYSESLDRLRCIELTHSEKCRVTPSYYPRQSFTGPYTSPFQPIRSYYSPGLYQGRYCLPYIHHELGIRQEAPSCSWRMEEEWKGSRGIAISDKPLNLSKHPG